MNNHATARCGLAHHNPAMDAWNPNRGTEQLAAAAAALVVDEGMEYGAAKRKAARQQHGHHARVELPSNEQVEDAVREHIALVCPGTQAQELRALREVALLWMQRLHAFRPHLSGAAWRGTATQQSAVHIDLYCDDTKAAEIALINSGVPFDTGAEPGNGREPLTILTLASRSAALRDPVTVHLLLHDADDLRGALKPDARGRNWRGNLAALEKLLASADGWPPPDAAVNADGTIGAGGAGSPAGNP